MSIEDTIRKVKEGIDGRLCDEAGSNLFIIDCILKAQGGNYLEIGSLFGGSAIIAALTMKQNNLAGHVWAIDPFNGYYMGVKDDNGNSLGEATDTLCHEPITLERAQANATKFGVEKAISFIKSYSYPFPAEAMGRTYSVSYIDGDHWNDGPIKDWLSVKDITSKFVIFDNWDSLHPAVQKAAAIAANDPEWEEYEKGSITYVVKRKENK